MANHAFIWWWDFKFFFFYFFFLSPILFKYIFYYKGKKTGKNVLPLKKFWWIHITNDVLFLSYARHSLGLPHSFISLPRVWCSEPSLLQNLSTQGSQITSRSGKETRLATSLLMASFPNSQWKSRWHSSPVAFPPLTSDTPLSPGTFLYSFIETIYIISYT